jgi:hypothetical protein
VRTPILFLIILAGLAACGESADDLAFARCKDEISKTVGPKASVAKSSGGDGNLTDDPIYGWHMDVDVETDGRAGQAEYRCLFLVEGRETPLFLAYVER